MMKNFKVGKDIKNLLVNDTNVQSKLNGKVFPIVANEGTQFPFVVYRRSAYRPQSNKDYSDEVVSMEIIILSTKYDESVDIANVVAEALDRKTTEIISDIQLTNISEDYIDDTYVQRLFIDISINN